MVGYKQTPDSTCVADADYVNKAMKRPQDGQPGDADYANKAMKRTQDGQPGLVIWLNDTVGYSATQTRLRSLGYDVRPVNDIGNNSGLVLRMTALIQDLTTQRGTPYGGIATSADLMYRCQMDENKVEVFSSGIELTLHSYTGRGSSQLIDDLTEAHVMTATRVIQKNTQDISRLADSCNAMRNLIGLGNKPSSSQTKKK